MAEFPTKEHGWGEEAGKTQQRMARLTDNRNVIIFFTVINF